MRYGGIKWRDTGRRRIDLRGLTWQGPNWHKLCMCKDVEITGEQDGRLSGWPVREDARLLIVKCNARKIRLLGIDTHCRRDVMSVFISQHDDGFNVVGWQGQLDVRILRKR